MATGEEPRRAPETAPRKQGIAVFVYSCVCLLLLLGIGWAYLTDTWVQALAAKYPLLRIAWWGSIGGLVANLEVVARAQHRWRPNAEFWYFGRPVTAAFFGGVGYVVYMTLVQASLNAPDPADQLARTPAAIGYVIAFALGLREQTFRELLGRVFDLLATAGGADVEPPSVPPDFAVEYDAAVRGVRISWGHATDNVGVTVYHVYRDHRFLASVRPSSRRAITSVPEPPATAAAEPPAAVVPEPPPTVARRFWSWASRATPSVERPAASREAEAPEGSTEKSDLLCFVDRSATAGGLRRYAVTAADAADNESAPAGPIAVQVLRTGTTER